MKCKALTLRGEPCSHEAVIAGYCTIHFKMEAKKPKKRKGKFMKGCHRCPKRHDCRLVELNNVLTCHERARIKRELGI